MLHLRLNNPSKNEMKTIQNWQRERFFSFSFTLIEILIVVAIISILAGMLMVALQKVREKGRRIVCMNNEMQIGKAIYLYANDYDGYIVPIYWSSAKPFWPELLLPYLGQLGTLAPVRSPTHESIPVTGLYKCPSGQADIPRPPEEGDHTQYDHCQLYGINIVLENIIKIEDVHRPSEKILLGEIQHVQDIITHYAYYDNEGINAGCYDKGEFPEPTTLTGRHLNAYRHNDGANFLFVDGHVEWWPRLGKDWKDPDIEGAYNKHWDLTAP